MFVVLHCWAYRTSVVLRHQADVSYVVELVVLRQVGGPLSLFVAKQARVSEGVQRHSNVKLG